FDFAGDYRYRRLWRGGAAAGSVRCAPVAKDGAAGMSDLLSTGLAHHQAGRLAEAERCYRQLLSVQPDHADALHLLGLLAFGARQFDAAIGLVSRAIELSPGNAAYHYNLGIVLRDAGRLAEQADRPTWILLPFRPEWRWELEREDSPWYPSARLFRQRAAGDWDGVIARVCDA